jgi:hypothetical protein
MTGEDQAARVGRPVQDAVDGHGDVVGGLLGDHAAGVAVAVVAREVAAGNLEPDPVAGQEDVGRDRQVQAELVGLAGGEGLGFGQRVAVPGPQDAVGQEDGAPVGEHVDQLAGEVGVRRRGGGEQGQRHVPGDLDRLGQDLAGEAQDVVPRLGRALVHRARRVRGGRQHGVASGSHRSVASSTPSRMATMTS